MIHVDPSLFLRRLVIISYTGTVAYDQHFHKGLNVIRGQNSSGKSTIANFIFYILGGDYNNWTTEASKCREIYAEVLLNDSVATLKRGITQAVHQPMSIYWGSYEEGLKDGLKWQTYPYRQTENLINFSRVIFNALGFPDVKTDEDASITMHQILRILYIDQDTATQNLFRAEKFDPPLTRQTVAEILLGIYDDSLYSDRVSLRNSEKQYDEKKSLYEGIRRGFSQAGEITPSELERSLEEAKISLDNLDGEIIKSKSQNRNFSSRKALEKVDTLQSEFTALKKIIITDDNNLQELEVDIFDSQQFIKTLERRIKEIDYSLVTRKYLGELTLTHCPNCLAKLTETALDGHCFLCKQPLEEEAERSNAKKLKQELELQIQESKSLLENKQSTTRNLRANMPARIERAKFLQREIDRAVKQSQSSRDEKIDELLIGKGRIEQQIRHLTDRIKAASILSQLREELAQLAHEIENVKLQIKEKEDLQTVKSQAAMSKIRSYTLNLLRNDLPRQAEFRSGTELEIDFRRDSYSLDGSNNFSASSKIYLKNSILYSIFFSSLDLDFMRYPRFILCDNMEDKGMEKERSQNFQNIIARISQNHQTEHQIIFTTSMISNELNSDTAVCIGDYYTDQHKTLRI
ncbi:ATP-binding protein [Chryseolinea soli]|uniref:Rad50/SbcC-type AAA domain-containing protein n=1 Tax=Chryseolinea soli TaxID=2321403 RepID=A0A385SNG2_9BACT|nr:ATP-binding protein [Chryseolinea soli]AYB32382.1 hypothetical protein D4L85_18195 [Chryseolinea soli]